MADEAEQVLPAYPETHRLTVRLSTSEYEQLCEIAEYRWDFKTSLNVAMKRLIRDYYRNRAKRKVVKG